jgi:hypothetical protein
MWRLAHDERRSGALHGDGHVIGLGVGDVAVEIDRHVVYAVLETEVLLTLAEPRVDELVSGADEDAVVIDRVGVITDSNSAWSSRSTPRA